MGIRAQKIAEKLKVLVIGGAGFTGSVLVHKLLDEGHQVTVFDALWFGLHYPKSSDLNIVEGDIRETKNIPFDGQDFVIHLANVANDPSVDLNPTLSWEVNVLASMGIAEGAIKAGVGGLIFASSGSVYGVKDEPRVTEDLELMPISVYNKTKMIAERVFLSYADQLKIWIVRPATVCGLSPRMRLDLSVNLLTYAALAKHEITVFGGDQVRPNIHIDDLARAYLHLMDGKAKPGVYNAGFENISILEIAKSIANETGAEIKIVPSNDPRSYRQDSSKLLATGYVPEKSVDYAIKELTTAYKLGNLVDQESWHTVKSMKIRGLG